MKWLHISDIHYSPENNGEASDKILESFLKEITGIGNIDALFITGDFRSAYDDAIAEPVTEIAQLIKKIATECGVESHCIFLVPGNHDYINRELQLEIPITYAVDQNEGVFRKRDISQLNERFKFFWKLYYKTKGSHPNFNMSNTVCWIERINDSAIICLNTAIADRRSQQIDYGSFYLKKIVRELDENIERVYILAHHSLQRLSEGERTRTDDIINGMLKNGKKVLWLCGHNHKFKAAPSLCNNFIEIGVGSLKGRIGNKISFIIGDTQDETFTVFEYSTDSDSWPNKCRPLFSQNSISSDHSNTQKYFNASCQQKNKFYDKFGSADLSLFEFLPIRAKYDYPENPILKNLSDLYTLDKNFAIIGVSGIGKTSFLLHLWDQLLKDSHNSTPLFIPCFELSDSQNPIADYVSTTYDCSIGQNIILLVDAVNEYRYSLDIVINELQQYVSISEIQLILSSTSDCFSARNDLYRHLVIYEIEKFSSDFIKNYISSLGKIVYDDKLISLLSTPMLLCLYIHNTAALEAETLSRRNIANIDVRENMAPMDLFHNHMLLKMLGVIEKVSDPVAQVRKIYKQYVSLFWFYPFISYKMGDGLTIKSESIVDKFFKYYQSVMMFVEDDFLHTYLPAQKNINTHITRDEVSSWIKESLFCNESPGIISITHQEFRDFFAAIFYRNCFLTELQSVDGLPAPPKSVFIDDHLSKRLGEYFSQRWDRYSTLFSCFFDMYRGKTHTGDFLLSNLINILRHIQCQPLANYDFSHIDLSHILLNGIVLSSRKRGTASNFSASTISYNTIMPQGHSGDVYCVRYAPDGQHFLSASYDGDIRIWNRDSGECKRILQGHKGFIHQAVYSRDGCKIASCARDGKVILWNSNGGILNGYDNHATAVRSVFFSYDGSQLLSSSENGSIIIYDINCKTTKYYHVPNESVYCAIFNSAEDEIFACTSKGNIFVFDIIDSTCRTIISTLNSKTIRYICWHPNGIKRFSTCSSDGSILEFNYLDGKYQISEIGKSSNQVVYVEYGSDGNTLLACCHDGSINLWNLAKRKVEISYKFEARALCATFSRDENFILASFDNGDIRELSLKRLDNNRLHKGQMRSILNFSFKTDSSLIYIPSQDGSIYFSNINSGRPVKFNDTIRHNNAVTFVKYISTIDMLLSGSYDGTAILWNAKTKGFIRKYSKHTQPVMCIDYDYCSKTFITASYDGLVCEWNIEDNTAPVHTYYGGATRAIRYAIYCSNFKSLAAGSYDKNIYIFDRKNFSKPIHVLAEHSGLVLCLDTTPDGNILFSGSDDNSIREWDIHSGKCIGTYFNTSCVFGVKFDAERDIILAALYNGSIVEWKRGKTANPIFECKLFSSPATFTDFVNDSDNIVVYASSYQGSLKKITRSKDDPFTVKEIEHVLTLFSGLFLDGCNFENAVIDDEHTYDILCQNGAKNIPQFPSK